MPRSARIALTTLLASALAVAAGPASALCTDGRHPSLPEEFADSDIVATGTARFVRHAVDPKDPDGYVATIHEIRVREIFRGRIPKRLYVETPNTSARFPLDAGTTYLLFLHRDANPERYFIDNCGHSAPVDAARRLLPQVRALRASGSK
ncbi:hypothetical protein [Lysobacter hankyongensis]|uniref:Uncharacterized protein n=1 Tax=Lysobacter hankyongensis TaxID=1176535 RepID=A0ABP9BX11_9GAMM